MKIILVILCMLVFAIWGYHIMDEVDRFIKDRGNRYVI